jgi:hypothetical protein
MVYQLIGECAKLSTENISPVEPVVIFMRRRALLAILGSVSAGCLSSPRGNGPETTTHTATNSSTSTEQTNSATSATQSSETTTKEAVTPNPSDPIQLDCYNETDEEQSCTYSIVRNENTISDGKLEIPARDFASIDTAIEHVGEYELNISVDDIGEEAYRFNVEDYDLRMGSNLVVWIYQDGIQIGMEE